MAEKITLWCIHRLELEDVEVLTIEIVIKKMNEDSGYCEPAGENKYKLTIANNQGLRDFIMTVAHEMVHIKQWAKNEMYEYTTPGKVRFMKTKYDMNDLNYWDYPWEIEAFGKQQGLFVRFCEDTGIAARDDMKEEC